MKYLITGGCGFLGSNIASAILEQGNDLIIFDSLTRVGSIQNLEWLKLQSEFEFVHGDIRNINDVENLIKKYQPDVVYHLSGQVAMTVSILDPRMDFEVNVCGTFNLLNAIKLYSPNSIVIYSSTNKVYGDLEQFAYKETDTRYICTDKPDGFDEKTRLNFHSPYGVSKGAADQYMLDFARIFNIKTVVFRHSSMFGGRQFATFDQGWIGWFIEQAIKIKNNKLIDPLTVSGNGKQVRDLLYASDCVSLYLRAVGKINDIKGKAFNIGGGIENSLSIIELFEFLEEELDVKIKYRKIQVRESDQRVFVSDIAKINSMIGWEPLVTKEQGLRKMINWLQVCE